MTFAILRCLSTLWMELVHPLLQLPTVGRSQQYAAPKLCAVMCAHNDNSYNWESGSMTIFVARRQGVTAGGIRNSCDASNWVLTSPLRLDNILCGCATIPCWETPRTPMLTGWYSLSCVALDDTLCGYATRAVLRDAAHNNANCVILDRVGCIRVQPGAVHCSDKKPHHVLHSAIKVHLYAFLALCVKGSLHWHPLSSGQSIKCDHLATTKTSTGRSQDQFRPIFNIFWKP